MGYSDGMRTIVVIAHNLRSSHNVGSLLRTAEGLGVSRVYLTGYTPYPIGPKDERLPHLARKTDVQIEKTALGAQHMVPWSHVADIRTALNNLRTQGFTIAAVEQTAGALQLPDYQPPAKLALLVGREVEGIEPEILDICDLALEIPMLGRKESFNVVQAAAMTLYHCRFTQL